MAATRTTARLVCSSTGGALPAQALALRLEHLRQSPALSAFLPVRLRSDSTGLGAKGCAREQSHHDISTTSFEEESCAVPPQEAWRLAFDARGCREVQRRLETEDDEVRVALADGLRGHICDAVRSPHANFVVQRCVEVLRPAAFQFIIDELMGDSLMHVAQHKFGCRVVMRLLERGLPDQAYDLVEALVPSISELARHGYGNYVAQSMISHCTLEQRCRILDTLRREIASMCKDLYGSSVVRMVLASGTGSEGTLLARTILETKGVVQDLAQSRRGHAIIKIVVNLLEIPERGSFVEVLAGIEGLSETRYGRDALQKVGLKAQKKPGPGAVNGGA